MTKNAAVNFGCHCHCFHYFSAIIILSKIVAVIAKVDCRVFCHINSLGDKISNTAAPIQPNPFWFWEKYSNMVNPAKKLFHSLYRSEIDSIFFVRISHRKLLSLSQVRSDD